MELVSPNTSKDAFRFGVDNGLYMIDLTRNMDNNNALSEDHGRWATKTSRGNMKLVSRS